MLKKSSPNLPAARPADATRRSNPWHAVSVLSTPVCCQASQELRGRRFLSRDAPRLPLTDCPQPHSCRCAYKHHADRRGGLRRKDEITGLRRPVPVTHERRTTSGRRETDF
jgi:hypothetical protein